MNFKNLFFKENFTSNLQLCFGELLKNKANRPALIAYQREVYQNLDSKPQVLTAKEHRPAYGSDGDYFSKPSSDDVFENVYSMFHELDPNSYPKLR